MGIDNSDRDVVREFADRIDAERRARFDASTVEAMAAKLGVPEWHVYKVVLSEAEALVWKTHKGPPGREKLGALVASCVEYAKHCTRADGFKAVWESRAKQTIKDAATEFLPAVR